MPFETASKIRSFAGTLLKLSHSPSSIGSKMNLNVYIPPCKESSKLPTLLYLSGLTCTGDNCAEKGFLQPFAAEYGLAIVYPDTSPRHSGDGGSATQKIQGEDDSWDFGSGAGFYLDATADPWKSGGYQMESYITKDLLSDLSIAEFEVGWGTEERVKVGIDAKRCSILGHSMGGHGALTLYLKHPNLFKSVSAFSPICNPSACPWGKKAFEGYFGPQSSTFESWANHDATELIRKHNSSFETLIDVGTGDNFLLQGQLLPENFKKAAEEAGHKVRVRYQEGYDHSYYFISTFGKDHVEYHAQFLSK